MRLYIDLNGGDIVSFRVEVGPVDAGTYVPDDMEFVAQAVAQNPAAEKVAQVGVQSLKNMLGTGVFEGLISVVVSGHVPDEHGRTLTVSVSETVAGPVPG